MRSIIDSDPLVESGWELTTLPDVFGQPAERKTIRGRSVLVWQASPVTARGAWCYRIEGLSTVVVLAERANRGTAKSAAAAALRSAVRTGLR